MPCVRMCVCVLVLDSVFVFYVSVLKTIGIYLEEKMEIGIIEKDKGLSFGELEWEKAERKINLVCVKFKEGEIEN